VVLVGWFFVEFVQDLATAEPEVTITTPGTTGIGEPAPAGSTPTEVVAPPPG
jgi:hypothetical protein